MFFVCVWIYGFCTSGFFFFSNDFVSIVFGSEWQMEPIVVFSLALHFYVSSVMSPSYTYRTTLGYFVQGRFAPAAAAVINIILSVIMGKWIGLSGVFFATSISRFFTMGIVDPDLQKLLQEESADLLCQILHLFCICRGYFICFKSCGFLYSSERNNRICR